MPPTINCVRFIHLSIKIWIGANVWIGAGAIVLPGCRTGNNCVIATGSVVCNDIPDNVMAAGFPAKIKKKIEIED